MPEYQSTQQLQPPGTGFLLDSGYWSRLLSHVVCMPHIVKPYQLTSNWQGHLHREVENMVTYWIHDWPGFTCNSTLPIKIIAGEVYISRPRLQSAWLRKILWVSTVPNSRGIVGTFRNGVVYGSCDLHVCAWEQEQMGGKFLPVEIAVEYLITN